MYHYYLCKTLGTILYKYRKNIISLSLSLIIIITSTELIYSKQQPPAEAHNLSPNENSSLLKIFYQIYVEELLVQSNFPFNKTLAHEHSRNAAELVNKNWTNVVADRNIVANFLSPTLNDLNKLTESTKTPYSEIKGEVSALDNIMSEFTFSYLGNTIFYNSTIQALLLAEIANEINDKYGKAFGVTVNSSTMNISPMAMHNNKEPLMNTMNMMGIGKNTSHMTSQAVLSMSDYQTAQALSIQAQEILNKNLKPMAPMNATNANIELEKDVSQLKNAIDNKAPVMDIMKIVHAQIHPILITTYNLQLKR
jgi:hypothetical protein